jgi:hypothetical protein
VAFDHHLKGARCESSKMEQKATLAKSTLNDISFIRAMIPES